MLMPVLRFVLPGLLLPAGTTSWAQEAPTLAGILMPLYSRRQYHLSHNFLLNASAGIRAVGEPCRKSFAPESEA